MRRHWRKMVLKAKGNVFPARIPVMVTLTSGCHFDNLGRVPRTSALIECKDERCGEGGLCVLSSLTPQVIKTTSTNASLTLQRRSDDPVQHDLTTPQINPPSESLHLGQTFWTRLLRGFRTSLCKHIVGSDRLFLTDVLEYILHKQKYELPYGLSGGRASWGSCVVRI